MYKFANQCFAWRNRLLSLKHNYQFQDAKFYKTTVMASLRANYHALLGHVVSSSPAHTLLLGSHIDYLIEHKARIELISAQADIKNHVNPFRHLAVNIALPTYWRYLNHPPRRCTRLRLQENARLACEPNTTISKGAYISVWPNQTLHMGTNSYIGHNAFINTKCSMRIGHNTLIGFETHIMDYDGHPIVKAGKKVANEDMYGGLSEKIDIGDNVFVGFMATIHKGVTIHNNSMVASNSVVTRDVPANCIVAGNPAKIIAENIEWQKW